MTVVATSLAAVLVAVAIAFLLRNVFVAARTPIIWTIAAVVLTALLTPAVNLLSRKIPRVLAAAVVLLALASAYFVVGYRFVDDLSTGVIASVTSCPAPPPSWRAAARCCRSSVSPSESPSGSTSCPTSRSSPRTRRPPW